MNKGTITIELPILDDVDQMEVVNTFNEKQLWYVCAIAKAFEKSQQELERKDNIINELKEIFKEYHKHQNRLSWYEEEYIEFIGILENKISILDKIKELENDN